MTTASPPAIAGGRGMHPKHADIGREKNNKETWPPCDWS
jgi:hypothetical protein